MQIAPLFTNLSLWFAIILGYILRTMVTMKFRFFVPDYCKHKHRLDFLNSKKNLISKQNHVYLFVTLVRRSSSVNHDHSFVKLA